MPENCQKEEENEIEEFEKPLLFFPVKHVEYLRHIYQMLFSCVTDQAKRKLENSGCTISLTKMEWS